MSIVCLHMLCERVVHDSYQVSMYTFVSPLASSMMAPGLPILAVNYDIKSQTVLALTLSIYLLSFGIGVSRRQTPWLALRPNSHLASIPRSWIGNVWKDLGKLILINLSLDVYFSTLGASDPPYRQPAISSIQHGLCLRSQHWFINRVSSSR